MYWEFSHIYNNMQLRKNCVTHRRHWLGSFCWSPNIPSPESLCKDEGIDSLHDSTLSTLRWLKAWSSSLWVWSSTSTWMKATKQITMERSKYRRKRQSVGKRARFWLLHRSARQRVSRCERFERTWELKWSWLKGFFYSCHTMSCGRAL